MKAFELMTPDPTTALPSDSISHAAGLMATLGVGLIPVIDNADSGRLVGVITDRDIVVRCLAEGKPANGEIRDSMTKDGLATVGPESTVKEIATAMEQYQVRRVPVIEAAGRLIGIVSQADLARAVGPGDPRLVEEVLEHVSRPGALISTN